MQPTLPTCFPMNLLIPAPCRKFRCCLRIFTTVFIKFVQVTTATCYWSSDGVSRLGLRLDTHLETHFCESRSRSRKFQVSSRSRSRDLNIAKMWFIKISAIQRFLFVVFAGKKQPKHVRIMPEIWKKFKSEVMTTFFWISQNAQILKSRVSVSEFLMKSRSRRLRSRLHHCIEVNALYYKAYNIVHTQNMLGMLFVGKCNISFV